MNDFKTDFSLPFGLGGKKTPNYNNINWNALISNAARKYRVPESILYKMLVQESGNFDPDVVSGRRRSSAGAIGVAQFMPGTAEEMRTNFKKDFDPLDPEDAVEGAAFYLANLTDYYNGDWEKGVAAYNAGPGNVDYAIKRGGNNWRNELQSVVGSNETNTYLNVVYGGEPKASATSRYQDRAPDINDYPGIPDENGNMMPDYATWSQDLRAYWEAKATQRAYETGPASQYIDDVIKELELEIEAGNLNVRKASEVLNTRIQGYKTAMDFYSSEAFKYGAPPGATHIPAGQYGSRVLGRQDSAIQGGVTVNPMQEALSVYREAQTAMGGINTPTIPGIAANRQQATRPVAPRETQAQLEARTGWQVTPTNPAAQALQAYRGRTFDFS